MKGEQQHIDRPAGEVAPQEFGFPLRELRRMALEGPRDEVKAMERALGALRAAPELAARHYYSIPFKEKYKDEDGNWRERTVRVEGLSVVAAKSIGRCWGNCVFQGSLVAEEGDVAICQGITVDLETIYLAAIQKTARRTTIVRGKTIRLNDARWQLLTDATISKCVRNAILDIIPPAEKQRYFNEARRLAAGTKGDASPAAVRAAVQSMLAWGAKSGLAREDFERAMEGKALDQWDLDDVGHMKGMLNAIADRETTFYDVFGREDPRGRGAPEKAPEDAAAAAKPKSTPKPPPRRPTAPAPDPEPKPEHKAQRTERANELVNALGDADEDPAQDATPPLDDVGGYIEELDKAAEEPHAAPEPTAPTNQAAPNGTAKEVARLLRDLRQMEPVLVELGGDRDALRKECGVRVEASENVDALRAYRSRLNAAIDQLSAEGA